MMFCIMMALQLMSMMIDDVRARNLPKGLDDVLYNDGVTADEYDDILIHSAIGKYM